MVAGSGAYSRVDIPGCVPLWFAFPVFWHYTQDIMLLHRFLIGKSRLLGALLAALLACASMATSAAAEKRVALVIGNGKYGGSIGSLTNPPNDAKIIADKLSALGFQVIKLVNGDQKQMKRAISDFGEKLMQAGPEAVGLFFYAGHGVQIDGANYLIPVGAEMSREADAEIEAVNADWVLKQMQFAGNRVNIVLLDACRNNPLTRSFRSGDRGLARMDAPTGTFIGYSTAPGEVAADGNGQNSPYVTALAAELGQPGVPLEETFRNVRVRVMSETGEQQVPWESSSLTGAFYFKPGVKETARAAALPAPPAPAAATAGNEAGATETTFWKAIENSNDPAEYQAYLDTYPNGKFSGLARARLNRLSGGNVASLDRTPAPAAVPAAAAPAPAPTPEPTPEPTPAPVIELQPEPEQTTETAAMAAPPAGGLQISSQVAGMLDQYLRGVQSGKAAFAVSPDGAQAGYFICEGVGQCVPGKRSLRQNRDPNYARDEALRLCKQRAGQECIILFLRKDQRATFVRP